MSNSERSENRRREVDAILNRKPGTEAVTDLEDRYRVVGAADRSTYTNWLTPIEDHYVCHRNETLDPAADEWTIALEGASSARPNWGWPSFGRTTPRSRSRTRWSVRATAGATSTPRRGASSGSTEPSAPRSGRVRR